MTVLLAKRFNELDEQLEQVEKTRHYQSSQYGISGDVIDDDLLLNWMTKARSLVIKACGQDSVHYQQLDKAAEPQSYETSYSRFKRIKAVFQAAKEDFEGGYLVSLRGLVQAELFTTELEQASEFLSLGYSTPAAVIARVVLETTLREICIRLNVPLGKLEAMNAALAKAGAYKSLVQKQVTALAAVGNSAAHGKTSEFTEQDVESMIREVQRFAADHVT